MDQCLSQEITEGPQRKEKLKAHGFFKVLNELFSPYKVLDQNELLNLIREKYGKFLQ